MPLLRFLLMKAVQRVVTDPKTQQIAHQAFMSVKPKVTTGVRELRATLSEIDPRKDPEGFGRRLRQRLNHAQRNEGRTAPEILPPEGR